MPPVAISVSISLSVFVVIRIAAWNPAGSVRKETPLHLPWNVGNVRY
jgi:hypothetical protein